MARSVGTLKVRRIHRQRCLYGTFNYIATPADPYYDGPDAFESVLRDVELACTHVVEAIQAGRRRAA